MGLPPFAWKKFTWEVQNDGTFEREQIVSTGSILKFKIDNLKEQHRDS